MAQATISVDTKRKGGRVSGCVNTNACANTVACFAEGKPVDMAWEITSEQVIDYLETLPPHETHCAELAVGALYLALANLKEKKGASPTKNRAEEIQLS